jgi:outer membrane receptor protein involved in Fe transport
LGNQYWNLENSYKEGRYGLMSVKLSLIKKGFQLDIWAKNLLNESYHSFLFEALGNTYVQKGKPLQVGVNVSLKF